jgi:hypothetical protein
MHIAELFMAGVQRDVKVIQAMRETLSVLERVNSVPLEALRSTSQLIFTIEIERLKDALRMMGVRDDARFLEPPSHTSIQPSTRPDSSPLRRLGGE